MKFLQGDAVRWIRKDRDSAFKCQVIPAKVSHKHKDKIAIKVKDFTGTEGIRFVREEDLEPDEMRV